MRGKNIRVICDQHQERLIRDIIEGYPEEVGHEVVQKARSNGCEIPIRLSFIHSGKEPYFNPHKNILVVNC